MADKDKQFQNFANFLADYGTKRDAGEDADFLEMYLDRMAADDTDQKGGDD